MSEFVDLNRRFAKTSNKKNPEESAFQSYLVADMLGIDGNLGWAEILKSPISVILGEPGSGKSAELRQQCDRLNRESKTAFFLQLDRLVDEQFESVIGTREWEKFENWKKSRQAAYFFFDSVDESKLRRPDDFLVALSRISGALKIQDLMRAHLVFSSRISEWRPVTDMQALRRHFPISDQPGKKERSETTNNRSFLNGNSDSSETETASAAKSDKMDPLVVQILPLDGDRVRAYARWRGLADTERFVAALDSRHAWEFARRPLDVHSLIEFWRSHHRLGTLTELIEHSLSVSLRETEGRETLDPLSPATARQGAEALAAAALLCRNLNFKVPDDAFVPVETSALNSGSCLPATWKPQESRALLTRTLFDGATYGCIRFHHSRTMEYLAASWFNERMRNNCPQDHLDDLLFAMHNGEYILRPALAPVAAWLANGSEPHNIQVREQLLQSNPSVYLKYGDPERLPIEYKKRVLNALVSRNLDRERTWVDTDHEVLAKLADPALAPDILGIIRNRRIASSLRADMLLLVRHGRLENCLEAALEIFADSTEAEDIKHYALAAIRDCGDADLRRRLAAIADGLTAIPSSITGLVCETLCQDIIDANGLADLLRKTERSTDYSFHLPWILKDFIKKLAPDRVRPFLDIFIGLLYTEPYLEDGRDSRISQKFHWLCEVLPSALIKVLEKNHLDPEEVRLSSETIRILEEDSTYGGHIDSKETKQISTAVHRHPALKSHYFWQGVEQYRSANHKEPDWLPQVMGFHHNLVEIKHSDISWLSEAVRTRQSHEDRSLALYFALDLWQPYSLKWMPWLSLLKIVIEQPGLRGLFLKYDWNRLTFPMRAFWYRNVRHKLLYKYWWSHKGYSIRNLRDKLNEFYLLHSHLNRLYSGSAIRWLSGLSHEAHGDRNSGRWAADDWVSLRKKRGHLVAWATRHGCEVLWLKHIPLLPHEKPNPNQTSSYTVVGLCGLQSLWRRGKLDFAVLSRDDAVRAARYSVNELNGFSDWLPELVAAKPDIVRDVLTACIDGDWQIPADRQHANEILSKLSWQGEPYWPLISVGLLSRLQARDPLHPQILNYAITILLKLPDPTCSDLIALASRRVTDYQPASPFFMTWMALWLELEAPAAMNYLTQLVNGLPPTEADNTVLRLCNSLRGEGINPVSSIADQSYLEPQTITNFLPFVYRYIRPSEDITHTSGEAYSPSGRDHAQEFRSALLQRFAQSEQPGVLAALKALRDARELSAHRDWIIYLIEKYMLNRADLAPWQPEDIRVFTADFETDPRNDTDLFQIACWRFQDIKHGVERSENSLREEVNKDWDEPALRRWFQRKLNERSRQRYTIPQEAEIDQEQRPDLRFENPQIPSAVPVELKWAENWTAVKLLERLENQLVGQYLRAYNTRYGIYLLGYIGAKQQWQHPIENRMIDFEELVRIITQRASELVQARYDVADIRVVSINFTISQ